ncbi:MAG TPA: Rrf2 family transcriptional regulator [Candidatus Polarisedimenticolia bacterium]
MAANSRFPVAVHIMTALGYRDGESLSSPRLARSVNTNPVVIRRLLGQLRRAGLVRARPGKSGGARLARRAEAISLMDIYRAIGAGGPFSIPDKPEHKACEVSCRIKRILCSVLAETEASIAKSLEKVRLSDLVRDIDAAVSRF